MINFQQLEADYIIGRFANLLFNLEEYWAAGLDFTSLSILLILVLSLTFVLLALRKVILIWKSSKEPAVLLELTPPYKTEQEAYTTEQFFSLIHALGKQRTFIDRLLGNKTRFSLEIVSTRKQGIRYLLRTNPKEVNSLKRSLLSYLPQMAVKSVGEYLPENTQDFKNHYFKIVEFKLSQHFAYPLKKQDQLTKHDPIAYITGMMTKLEPSEIISLQIIVSPVKPKEVKKISNLILYNGEILNHLNSLRVSIYFWLPVTLLKLGFTAFFILFSIPFWIISNLATNGQTPFPSLPFTSQSMVRSISIFEQEMVSSIHAKIDQPLFEVTTRLLVVVKKRKDSSERLGGLIASFATFSNGTLQSIVPIRSLNLNFARRYLFFMFAKRQFALSKKSILSVSEISDIYHFPFTRITKTEDLIKVHSKQLPAPVSLKRAEDLDISFANNIYGGSMTKIGLNEEERRRHVYILGATGTGKSTLLLSMVNQDIENSKGLCVIDPHGDLIEKILPSIPKKRLKDVIYFNPDDIGFPIGLNLLELSENLSEEDSLREKEFITESIISLFEKLYDEKYSGPRMQYILRNTIHTAFSTQNPTLFTIYKLLINARFRKSVTNNLADENLKDFWKYEFSKAGDYQKIKMISPITNKIGRFLFSATAKRILEQEKSSINFDEILDSGKILLCNLAKGRIGEDTSEVFGVLVMTKIQLAALKRARVDIEKRPDFYLYVDEFQNFATPAFAQILSEARKYRLNAILAHQTVSQIQDKSLVHITLANTGTVICFRTANPEDERLILPQFTPYVQQGEIASLPSFNFYIKISALEAQEPCSGETIPIEVAMNKKWVSKIVQASRKRYARAYVKREPSAAVPEKVSTRKSATNRPQGMPVLPLE